MKYLLSCMVRRQLKTTADLENFEVILEEPPQTLHNLIWALENQTDIQRSHDWKLMFIWPFESPSEHGGTYACCCRAFDTRTLSRVEMFEFLSDAPIENWEQLERLVNAAAEQRLLVVEKIISVYRF